MTGEWIIYIRVRGEVAVDSGNGLTFNLHGKDAQALPVKEVYVNGVLQISGYTFNAGSQTTAASITFISSQTGKIVKANYRWKYETTSEENLSVYQVEKPMNNIVEPDVNGQTLVSVSYNPVGAFKGLLTWEYMLKAFWQEWQRIAENSYLFDIETVSDTTEPETLSNLLTTGYPKYEKIPGVPGRVHVGVEFVKVTI